MQQKEARDREIQEINARRDEGDKLRSDEIRSQGLDRMSLSVQVSLFVRFRGILLCSNGSCLRWSATLDSSGALLSHPLIPLASLMTNILISTLF